jgi:hypothetical protein
MRSLIFIEQIYLKPKNGRNPKQEITYEYLMRLENFTLIEVN